MSTEAFDLTKPELTSEDLLVLDDPHFGPETVAVVTGAASGIDVVAIGRDVGERLSDVAVLTGDSESIISTMVPSVPTDSKTTDDEYIEVSHA